MNCSCAAVDVDEYSTILYDKIIKARKAYKCSECREKIEVGQQYRKETVIFDGEISSTKTCLDCVSVRDTFFCDGFYWEMLWEHFYDYLQECAGEISQSSIAGLTFKAREKVCDMIEACWCDNDEN